ncbi:hypothetical protein SPI_07591 [Niveomyces insectorum RCEF 264]|uniref:Uncharacterized protein n=1 Tax=Niveomyces insectorum RCEF 264 TaxID=1081102 RepID=A0A167PEM1_9HYPO|nr:hypothetical protein SPI_07591 [Niveomyces insectorum RCEF 264]
MSIARAFTTRRVRQTLEFKDNASAGTSAGTAESIPQRSKTTRVFGVHGSIRHKISAPVELTHTTNMLSYNAPDIVPLAASQAPAAVSSVSSSAASSPSTTSKSDDESDSGLTAASTPPTSPDTPFPDDLRSASPQPNHLSCYFTPPKQVLGEFASNAASTTAATTTANTSPVPASGTAAFPASDAPIIPQRAPSHTKKSYEGLTRHRSVSRMSDQSARSLSTKASFSFSRSSSSSTSTSVTSTSHASISKPSYHAPSPSVGTIPSASSVVTGSTPPVSHKKEYSESHPFGHELAKVSELVEEFGKEEILHEEPAVMPTPAPKANRIVDDEERELVRQGLKKFSAEEYLSDIQSLMAAFFVEARPMATVWI